MNGNNLINQNIRKSNFTNKVRGNLLLSVDCDMRQCNKVQFPSCLQKDQELFIISLNEVNFNSPTKINEDKFMIAKTSNNLSLSFIPKRCSSKGVAKFSSNTSNSFLNMSISSNGSNDDTSKRSNETEVETLKPDKIRKKAKDYLKINSNEKMCKNKNEYINNLTTQEEMALNSFNKLQTMCNSLKLIKYTSLIRCPIKRIKKISNKREEIKPKLKSSMNFNFSTKFKLEGIDDNFILDLKKNLTMDKITMSSTSKNAKEGLVNNVVKKKSNFTINLLKC
jgi:hypothetical protein